jgi:hypothetical protein
MGDVTPDADRLSLVGCLVALGLIFIPGAVGAIGGSMPSDDWPFALFEGVILAIPFGYLAVESPKSWFPWFIAVVFTSGFCAVALWMVWDSSQYQSGVNFAIIPLMILSPIVTTAAAWAAVQSGKDRGGQP